MLKKASIGKGVSIVLVISMFGMGAPSLPSAYASGQDNTTQVSTQNDQKAPVNVLSKLEIEGTPFDQTFSPDCYQYTATVENNVQSITLLANSENENAKITITVNGQTVEDGTSKPIPLQTGDNQIAIKVDDGVSTANTYNLTITRKKSSNNLLQDLQLSGGELSQKFDASTTSYTVQVANDVNALTVTPVAAEKTASILVNDTAVTDKGVSVQLSAEKTEITIVVTAENGDKKTYSLEVTKANTTSGGSGGTGSSNSSSGGTGSSNSSSGGTGSSNFPSGSNRNNQSSNLKTTNNSFSQNSNRSAGSFSLRNTSSSQMQGSQQGGAAVQQPSKATLSALTVSAGTWNKTFSKDTYTYHIAVDSQTDSVTVNEGSTYSGATVTIQDGTTNTISLGSQKKTIVPIVVTNGDEHKTYILVFDKDVPQAVATQAASQTVSSTDNTATDASIKNTSVTSNANNWSGKNNSTNGSSSFWSRLIESIRTFFSKL